MDHGVPPPRTDSIPTPPREAQDSGTGRSDPVAPEAEARAFTIEAHVQQPLSHIGDRARAEFAALVQRIDRLLDQLDFLKDSPERPDSGRSGGPMAWLLGAGAAAAALVVVQLRKSEREDEDARTPLVWEASAWSGLAE
jgi:hypothetical protein